MKWYCESCEKYIENYEVEVYGDDFCHVVPEYNQLYDDWDPEPCGPVKKLYENK